MKKILVVGFLLLVFTIVSNAQTKTIKGYFCGGQAEGNAFATTKIRIGKTIFDFPHSLTQIKYIGFKKKGATKISVEYIVKYRNDGDGDWAESIAFTGIVRKNIKYCSVE